MAGLKRECGEMFLQNALSRGRGHQAAPCAQPCRVAALPYPAYKNLYSRYPSLIIVKNRFTVRERSNRRQQSAISV